MKILVLDNYDSFTYNLVHLLYELGLEEAVEVFRNDEISLEAVDAYDKILLSPGPGLPSEAGIMPALIQRYAPTKSILGVCLGHQAIGEAFGARLLNLPEVLHGVASPMHPLVADRLFEGVPAPFQAAHYHSWVIDREGFPHEQLEVIAQDEQGHIMAVRHRLYDVRGVQFHPESILTEYGKQMLHNWLSLNPSSLKAMNVSADKLPV
jgi:anthranilate synthase component 2